MSSDDERTPGGESFEDAVPIQAASSAEGVPLEYQWLDARFGSPGRDFQLVSQSLVQHEDRHYDVITIQLADGTARKIHFDITDFFGNDDIADLLSGLGFEEGS